MEVYVQIAWLSWWRNQMETFSALLAICAGSHRSPVNSPHKGQWRGALMFSLICVWINGWLNNYEAGDLKRYHARYDVIVMRMRILGNPSWLILGLFRASLRNTNYVLDYYRLHDFRRVEFMPLSKPPNRKYVLYLPPFLQHLNFLI